MNSHTADDTRWTRLAHRSVAGGGAVRVLWGLVLHPPLDHLSGDAPGYVHRAMHLAHGATIPRIDLFMPVGTQLLVSLPMRLFGTGRDGLWAASVLWCALACAYPWLAWRWARLVLSPRAAALTALACAVSPLAIIYGGYFGSELPAIVLLPGALWLFTSWAERMDHSGLAVAAGGVAVALLVIRQQLILNLLIAAAPVVRALHRPTGRKAVAAGAAGAVAALGVVLVLAAPPWRVSGGFPPIFAQNGGLNFFYGHCDARHVSTIDLFFENPVRAQRHTGTDFVFRTHRAADQGFFYRQGWDCIHHKPARAIVLALRSGVDMTTTSIPFPPWTESGAILLIAETSNAAFCVVLVLLVAAALRQLRRDAGARLLLLHLACAFAVAVAFLGEPRYRVPYDLFGWALLAWWLTRRSDASA